MDRRTSADRETGGDWVLVAAEGSGGGSDLEAGQLAAVIHAHRLDLRGFAIQVSVVQSFHLTLFVPESSRHLLPGYGFGQVLALRVIMEMQKGDVQFDMTGPWSLLKSFTSTAITPPGLKRYGAFGASLFRGKKSGLG